MVYPNFKNKHLEKALFSPGDYIRYKKYSKKLPKKYILIYQKKVLDDFKRKYNPKKIELYSLLTIYIHKDIGLVRMTGIGSPNAVAILEELIALGGKTFLNIGSAGGLKDEGIFLCTSALRDEGTSYHYLPHSNLIYPNKKLTEKLGESLLKKELKYSKSITWTIDAPYRETKAEIEHYRKKGIATVEMEASALFAVAKVRKIKIASAFVVSDLLIKKWEPKFHTVNLRKTLNKVLDAAIDCLI